MAFGAGKSGIFSLDNGAGSPTDISAYLTKVDFPFSVAMLDTTVFGVSAETEIPGLKAGDKIALAGNTDPTVHTQLGTIYNNGGGLTSGNGSLSFVYGPMGSTTGNPKFTGECFLSSYKLSTDVKGLNTFTAELTVTAGSTSTVY